MTMRRRDLIVPAAAPALWRTRGFAATRPNIIYIIVHDLGTALGSYGDPNVRTPRLDEFAAQGVRFTNYFCCSTCCSPSRGCIMTGRYAHSNGLIGLANRNWHLPDSELTIVDYLNQAGYETVNIGGQHERTRAGGPNPNRYRQIGPARRNADLVAEDVCRFLESWKPAGRPLYLNVYMQDPHAPWNRPEFQGRYRPEDIVLPPFLPNTANFRLSMAQFYGAVSFTDAACGRIFDTIRKVGLEEDSLVIFTTDHGISFPRAKGTLYDPGIRTALLVRWPGHIPRGEVRAQLLGNVDLLPTQLELAGVACPPQVQGRSFAPLLVGGTYRPNDQIFTERNYHTDYDPMRAVRTERFKLIRNYAQRDRYKLPAEAGEADREASMRDSGQPRPFEELYDLQADPNEFRNLAGDSSYEPVLRDLRGRLEKWMNETADFLRGAKGFVS
jgi:N-sulfoglucosamine sulfohydrolase